jgi:hypothetical protein
LQGTVTASRRFAESDFDEWEETCPVCNAAGTASAHLQKLYAHLTGVITEQNARLPIATWYGWKPQQQ